MAALRANLSRRPIGVGFHVGVSVGGRRRAFVVRAARARAAGGGGAPSGGGGDAGMPAGALFVLSAGAIVRLVAPSEGSGGDGGAPPGAPGAAANGPARIGFDAIGGLDGPIAAIRDMIELPLRAPGVFAVLGQRPPKAGAARGLRRSRNCLMARAAHVSRRARGRDCSYLVHLGRARQ